MSTKNLHNQPFDESTIAKLEIFEDYAQEWVPTFVMKGTPQINIFDFFAGTGYDKNGIAGSPIRTLAKIKEQIGAIFQKKVKVKVYLNEIDKRKFESLKSACEDFLAENKDVGRAIEIFYFNEDFEVLFPKLFPMIRDFPSLVYLDQNGIKFLSEKYFLELEKTTQTDFLYFVSTSYFWRFGKKMEFKVHLEIDMDEAKRDPYKFIHRSIIRQLREKFPANTNLRLYPFSLKKGSNIFGIIFGASHPRAVDKFLKVAWRRSPVNGEANFDIDDDDLKIQHNLFGEQPLTKIEAFQKSVYEKILSAEIKNNFELFQFTLDEGHIGKHSHDVLVAMKKQKEIFFHSVSPLVTYENVYKMKRKLDYTILKK